MNLDHVWNKVSTEAKTLIKKMMTYDPRSRITAEKALSDPWITKNVPAVSPKKDEVLKSLDQLKQFHAHSSIHKAISTYMAKYTISIRKEAKLRKIFQMIDKNNDGQLSNEEIMEAFKLFHLNDSTFNLEEVEATIRRIDLNKNGKVDYNGIRTG